MKKTTTTKAELNRDEAMNLSKIVPKEASGLSLTQKKDRFQLSYQVVEDDSPAEPATPTSPTMAEGIKAAESKIDQAMKAEPAKPEPAKPDKK